MPESICMERTFLCCVALAFQSHLSRPPVTLDRRRYSIPSHETCYCGWGLSFTSPPPILPGLPHGKSSELVWLWESSSQVIEKWQSRRFWPKSLFPCYLERIFMMIVGSWISRDNLHSCRKYLSICCVPVTVLGSGHAATSRTKISALVGFAFSSAVTDNASGIQ